MDRGNRFESAIVQLVNVIRPQPTQFFLYNQGIRSELSNIHPQQGFTKRCEVALSPLEHLQRAVVVAAGDLVVGQPDLQDPLVEVSFGGVCFHPAFLQGLMGLVIIPLVKELNTLPGFGMKGISLRKCTHW